MEKSWKIVRASYEDLPEIMEILKGACGMVKDPAWFYVEDVEEDEELLRQHVEEKGFILKAEAKDEIAGFLMVRFPGEEADNLGSHLGLPREEMQQVAHMETAAVRPKYCGQGIQKSLMRQGEEMLKGTSFRYLMGTAHPDNTYSVNNFLKLEYEIIDEARKYGGLPRYVFCKEIR